MAIESVPAVSGANFPEVLTRLDGDVVVVWPDPAGGRPCPSVRRFRAHLGHVVEVGEDGRIRRVGRLLNYPAPWLLADGPLESVIRRELSS